jgi:PelA/Pel-15E family pectate lyase
LTETRLLPRTGGRRNRFPRVSWALVLATGLAVACGPTRQAAAPLPPPGEGELLAPERLAALTAAERAAWESYIEISERQRETDRDSIGAELEALGRERWIPAPEARGRILREPKPDEWFGGDEARRLAEAAISYQTPAGGWSKNVDYRRGPRQPGQNFYSTPSWSYIGTFDNDATTDEMWFLARVHEAQGDTRFRDAFLRGLEYVFRAQFPNGCWPQVYPLQGGYHDAATYNDEAIPNILELLRDVGRGHLAFVPAAERRRAEAAVREGVECILASQVVVDGRLTVWGQQHDPLTLVPVQARAYEHAALTAGESVDVAEFLMQLESPDDRVVRAVHAAAAWFRATAIHGYDYEHPRLIRREGGGPIWARFFEIGTNRPIFSNRDGQILYDWHDIDDERRRGYGWYRSAPAGFLAAYAQWATRHPATN